MSAIFFRELEYRDPSVHLGISGGSHGAMTGRMLEAIEAVLVENRPDGVLVYGDTNSTLAGALAAAKLDLPLIHVEAGLRSYRRSMPEEINRILTDRVSSLLLCPTRGALKNLTQEGITVGCHHVGDVMYDATLHARDMALQTSTILSRLDLKPGAYTIATLHRAENTDDPVRLATLIDLMRKEARTRPVVLPLHPRTAKAASKLGLTFEGITLQPPLGYLDMHRLLSDAALVMTDLRRPPEGSLLPRRSLHHPPRRNGVGGDDRSGMEQAVAGTRLPSARPIADYGTGDAATARQRPYCRRPQVKSLTFQGFGSPSAAGRASQTAVAVLATPTSAKKPPCLTNLL